MRTIWTRFYAIASASLLLAGCAQQTGSVPAAAVPNAVPNAVSHAALVPDEAAAQELSTASGGKAWACPHDAVFLRLDTEIRGYPLGASGVTPPCTRIAGPNTLLFERGPLVVSVHGFLHSLSFQANGLNGLTIHAANSKGNVAPFRSADASQDHVALAVDSSINDFMVASEGYEGDNCWYVIPNRALTSNLSNCDSNVSAIHALATNSRDELLVAGTDVSSGASRIDIFDRPASQASHLVRSITGPLTELPGLYGTLGYFSISYSLATDPQSGAIYVYTHLFDSLDGLQIKGAPPAKILEFAANANGNVAPLRTLSGPRVGLVDVAFTVDILGLDRHSNLYVLGPQSTAVVSVFGPTASGNAAPERRFTDPTAAIGFSGAALAVRN